MDGAAWDRGSSRSATPARFGACARTGGVGGRKGGAYVCLRVRARGRVCVSVCVVGSLTHNDHEEFNERGFNDEVQKAVNFGNKGRLTETLFPF